MLKLLKKTGIIEDFSSEKIKKFLKKVNKELLDKDQISEQEISLVISEFEEEHNNETQVTQENLENFIENFFIGRGKSVFAKQYLTLRYQKAFENERSALDESILSLVENKNEEVGKENSNKDSRIAPTQRDLVAGEISKDIARRLLIPKDVMKAHDDGVIHMHDLDYFIQHIHNCELVDIKEVFENGTVMNGKMIETPKSFQVACTVLTQIIASVASSTYGGQTVNIKHLGKYLFLTKQKYFKKMKEEFGNSLDDEQIEKIVKSRVKDELTSGIQTMQYQINTLQTSNGQSAFVTLFLELDKNDPYINETAQIIAEIFKQRIEGIKNEKGVYVTPAFPKLVYVLDNHNNLSGGKYDYVTELAVECSAKRMYPDYISAKKMRENYEGNVFGPMGCVDGQNLIEVEMHGIKRIISFEKFWKEVDEMKCVTQHSKDNNGETYKLQGVKIKDRGIFVDCLYAQKNPSKVKYEIYFKNSSTPLICTPDHPLPLFDKGRTYAEDIKTGDFIETSDGGKKEVFLVKKIALEKIEYFYDVTTESDRFDLVSYNLSSHNCRAFLSPYKDENGKYKFEGRFNQGVVTLNLPQIALVAEGDEEKFWEELEERLTIAYKALLVRHNRLKGTKASVAPILWQHGILARLKPEDTIDHLLINGYSTLSLGYIGVYEATYLMKGVSHTNPKGEAFALRLMNTLRQHCDDWKRQTGIGFALYGTPAESLCYRFARIDKKKFGKITNITDKGYYTNSYHVDVREEIDAFAKLEFESQFQKISSGGCISYIEIPNMRNNLGALRDMVKYIYDNIQYAEFNTKTDVCNACGFEGEIELNEKMEWECPQCHNKDQTTMNVVRRTCGYLGENYWNDGKTREIGQRVLHLGGNSLLQK